MQEPPFDDTVQLSDMKFDVSDEAPIVENGQGLVEDPPDVETVTANVNQISRKRGYAIVAILFFVNLLNYMDRFTVAGNYAELLIRKCLKPYLISSHAITTV